MSLLRQLRQTGAAAGKLPSITRWRPGRYARDSVLTFFGLGARAIAQVATVLLLARWLGAEGYGQFVATLAVVSFFVPMAGMGLHGVLLRDIARTPSIGPQLLGQALALWWRSALVCSAVAALLAFAVLPGNVAWWAVAALAFGEVFSSSGMELLARVEQAHHRLGRFAALLFGLIAARLLALLLYAAFAKPELQGWMLAYTAASLFMLGATLAWAKPVKASAPIPWLQLAHEGWPFASGGLAIRLQTEFNKPVLAQIGFAEAGYYGIAQRVVDLACLPLVALQEALWPRVYDATRSGRHLMIAGSTLVLSALFLGLLVTLLIPYMLTLLGSGYEKVAQLTAWTAWLPTMQVIRNLGNAQIIASGHARYLTHVHIFGSLGSMIITVILIAMAGLVGAIAAAYLGYLITMMAQWVVRIKTAAAK